MNHSIKHLLTRPFIAVLMYRLSVVLCYQITAVAVGWQVYSLTGDPLALGLIGLAEVIPYFASALFAGYAVDHYNKRRLGMAACTLLLIMAAGLTIYSTFPEHTLKQWGTVPIYAAIGLSGFARAFISPVYNTLLVRVVPRVEFSRAASLGTSVFQLSQIGGPTVAGVLLFLGNTTAVYVATLIFACISLVALLNVPAKVGESDLNASHDNNQRLSIFSSIGQGLHFVFSNQVILGALALDMFAVLFGGAVALLPAFVSDVLHGGPEMLGMLRASPAIGALLMGLYLTRHPIQQHAGKILLAAVSGFGVCMLVFAVSHNFWLSLTALAFSGLFDSISVVLRSTILQLSTPDEMRGRVSAINGIFIGSSNELGAFESGVAAKWLGLVPSVIFGAGVTWLVVAITAKKAPKLTQLNIKDLI